MTKENWFQYVVENKVLWCHGFTKNRLDRVRLSVLSHTPILNDLWRHGADKMTPQQMKQNNPEMHNHCIGNFTCNILYKMMEDKIIKPK